MLILGAVVLLVLGLINGSSGLLVGSIGTSLLAAVALVVGVRQASSTRAAAGLLDEDEQFDSDEEEEAIDRRAAGRVTVPVRGSSHWAEQAQSDEGMGERSSIDTLDAPPINLPSQSAGPADDEYDDEDPPDEPVVQRVSAADAARVARMPAEVLVIDGRPRYHVAGCVHLLGRPYEPLVVSEAVELGFTPCGLCEPDSALLADARRV